MKRLLFICVVALVAGLWIADSMGVLTLPWHGDSAQGQGGSSRQGRRRGGGAGGQDQPVPVLVASIRRADVPVTLDSVGTVQPLASVMIRSQVDGRLVEIAFRDGQDVKRGDVLARIDPAIYQASYDQAMAKKAQDEAQLANAKIDLERYERLAQSNYGSKQQSDTQRASVAQIEAQIRADQAQIDNALAVLDYATIRAPIDGRTGIRNVDMGNIIHASDASGLVTLTQMKPIGLLFSLPQQGLGAATAAMARGPVQVAALEPDNARVLEVGRVDVIDNQVDPQTGTVRVRATFANENLQLWPGLFTNVRVTLDVLKDVLVAPTSAVQRGPDGPFVYVVRDDAVALVKVAVPRQYDRDAVLESTGLQPGDLVVTTGFAQLVDGRKVRVDKPEAEASAVPAAPRERRQGGGQHRERAPGDASAPRPTHAP